MILKLNKDKVDISSLVNAIDKLQPLFEESEVNANATSNVQLSKFEKEAMKALQQSLHDLEENSHPKYLVGEQAEPQTTDLNGGTQFFNGSRNEKLVENQSSSHEGHKRTPKPTKDRTSDDLKAVVLRIEDQNMLTHKFLIGMFSLSMLWRMGAVAFVHGLQRNITRPFDALGNAMKGMFGKKGGMGSPKLSVIEDGETGIAIPEIFRGPGDAN